MVFRNRSTTNHTTQASPIQICPSCCFYGPRCARNVNAARGSNLNQIRRKHAETSIWDATCSTSAKHFFSRSYSVVLASTQQAAVTRYSYILMVSRSMFCNKLNCCLWPEVCDRIWLELWCHEMTLNAVMLKAVLRLLQAYAIPCHGFCCILIAWIELMLKWPIDRTRGSYLDPI